MTDERAVDEREGERDAIRERVAGWLTGWGWAVEDLDSPEARWAIKATDPSGRPMIVARLDARPQAILLEIRFSADSATRSLLRGMSRQDRERMYWAIRFRLLQMGPRFAGLSGELEQVRISRALYLDGLTEDRFARDVETVQDSGLAVVWTVQQRLGQPAASTPDAGPGGPAPTVN